MLGLLFRSTQAWAPFFHQLNLAHMPLHEMSTVNTRTPSVPHMMSGAEVTMVPSCAFGAPCRPRWGESRLAARITRNTRVRETRTPSRIRSRAWTLRWPSPWNGERARSLRMAASNCAAGLPSTSGWRSRGAVAALRTRRHVGRQQFVLHEIEHGDVAVGLLIAAAEPVPRARVEHHVELLTGLLQRVGKLQRVLQADVLVRCPVHEQQPAVAVGGGEEPRTVPAVPDTVW